MVLVFLVKFLRSCVVTTSSKSERLSVWHLQKAVSVYSRLALVVVGASGLALLEHYLFALVKLGYSHTQNNLEQGNTLAQNSLASCLRICICTVGTF